MTAPVPEQPDLEAWLWPQLRILPGVTMWAYDATPMPMVPWLVAYQVQVDSRAGSKKAARDTAEQARQIVWGLPAEPWAEGVIAYVQVTDGPLWLADDDGTPRYVMRAEIRVHPAPRPLPSPQAVPVPAGDLGRPVEDEGVSIRGRNA